VKTGDSLDVAIRRYGGEWRFFDGDAFKRLYVRISYPA